jgi:hypothetical protein
VVVAPLTTPKNSPFFLFPSLRRAPLGLIAGAAALAVTGFSPRASAADGHVTLAAEVGVDAVQENTDGTDLEKTGVGAAARLGYTMGGPWLRVTPELKVGFEAPGTPNSFSVKGGARVNFLNAISPAIFAHAGGLAGQLSGFVWDIGVGLDFRIIPKLDIGAFASYNQAGGDLDFVPPSYQGGNDWVWFRFGAQAAIHFD